MIAISQTEKHFKYIIWIPTESGPLITSFGQVNLPDNFDISKGQLSYVLEEITSSTSNLSPKFQISLDFNNIFVSENLLNLDDYVQWKDEQSLNSDFNLLYDTYSYPFSTSLLNIHIKKSIKKGIINSIQEINGELRSLGLGIFSAEIGARKWFQASKIDSYAIWRIGRNHLDQLLIVKNGEFDSLVTFKQLKKNIKQKHHVGSTFLSDNLLKEIQSSFIDEIEKFNSVDYVYVYSCENNSKNLKNILEFDINNVILLNPFDVIDISSNKSVKPLKGATFAETGIGFRRVDV